MKNINKSYLFVALVLNISLHGSAQKLPNIVIYLADDQGQADGTVYGAKVLKTPTADILAKAGLTFNNAFIASPACAPSRAALLTGLMPARNGAQVNHSYPKSGTVVLTSKLQESGYKVLGFGKVAHDQMNKECGFDFYSEPRVNLYDHVSEYFRNNEIKEPVCLLVGDRRPHVPWTTKIIYDPATIQLPSHFIDTKETRGHWAEYYSDITGLDDEMGKVYRLAHEEFGDNFIFIYSADHGGQWPFGKWNLYPEYYHSNHSDILRKPHAGGYWDSWDEAAKTDAKAAAIIQKYFVRPAKEFYDIQADPTEQINLIDSKTHRAKIEKMRRLLNQWMDEQGDTKRIFETPYPITGLKPHDLGIR